MIITTERLEIRRFEPRDAEDLHEILGDAETMKFLEPPFSKEQTEEFLNGFCIKKQGALAAKLKGGKVIGYILFNPTSPGTYELGWVFNRAFWRKGYAFEALSAVIDYGFKELSVKKFIAETTDPIRSVGLMKKLGMRREGSMMTTDSYGDKAEMILYGLSEKESRCENV